MFSTFLEVGVAATVVVGSLAFSLAGWGEEGKGEGEREGSESGSEGEEEGGSEGGKEGEERRGRENLGGRPRSVGVKGGRVGWQGGGRKKERGTEGQRPRRAKAGTS